MNEKQLISKIKGLRQIKPSKDWVVLLKSQILDGQEEKKESWITVLEHLPRMIFHYNKLAFATLIIFGFVAGTFTLAQNSVPGDPLFVFKKLSERTQAIFISEEDLLNVQLEIANKRLDELNRIAQANQINKLAPAIQEFQANISKAAEAMIKFQNVDVEKIVSETKRIKEQKQQIESLGVVIGDTINLDSALLMLLERELADLEIRSLSERQQEIFSQAVKDFEAGNYSDALEKIWRLSSSQN